MHFCQANPPQVLSIHTLIVKNVLLLLPQHKRVHIEPSSESALSRQQLERQYIGARMSTVKAVAVISGADSVKGFVQFIQDTSGTHVKGRISGLSPGLHGFHIHALGDTTNGCNSTGPHFNPSKKDHGSPLDDERHAGDLGNIVAASDGVADISIIDKQIPLGGQHSILGRAVVVHADPDDLGKGGHELSRTTGNAGARVGCGIIGLQSSV